MPSDFRLPALIPPSSPLAPVTGLTPSVQWIIVTPAQALHWLGECNEGNRSIRDDHVMRLAADMAAGKWRGRNGEPIKFDTNGRMFEGQHRCWACVEANVPFETLMLTGCDPEDFAQVPAEPAWGGTGEATPWSRVRSGFDHQGLERQQARAPSTATHVSFRREVSAVMTPTVAEITTALIAVFEGPLRLKAFQDSGGIWTIGRGHTSGVTEGMACTTEQANAWFAEDQAPLFQLVAGEPSLAQAAYVSFGYNCGRGALRAVLAGHDTIMNPVHQTDRRGATLGGLTSRRRLEDVLLRLAQSAGDHQS